MKLTNHVRAPTHIMPIRVAIATAALAPLLSVLASMGCSTKNPYPEPQSPVAQTESVLGDRFCPNKEYSTAEELCVSNCSVGSNLFHHGFSSVVLDCSPQKGIYHKFAFTEGGKLLWEGFGDDSSRMFITRNEDNVLVARITTRWGSGWAVRQMGDYHITGGEGAEQKWVDFINSTLAYNGLSLGPAVAPKIRTNIQN